MTERPDLSAKLDAATFRSYYYLKEELVSFCRENGLPASGGKEEITERIACYLDTGRINPVKKVSKSRKEVGVIRNRQLLSLILFVRKTPCFSKKNRKQLSFRSQKWLKTNSGKTYAQAIEAYYQILEERKGKTVIDRQFEYNTYTGFLRRIGKTLQQAIVVEI
ncbi:MAG: SAP domain-containing protein [Eisenbergiella sp.]